MCDYCQKPSVVKVTVWNHYWMLCRDCAVKNAKRFNINIGELDAMLKQRTEGQE